MKDLRRKTVLYELWFRMSYRGLLKEGAVTAAVRPGDRRSPQPKGTNEGSLAIIRVLKIFGDEKKGIVPVFDRLRRKVRIDKIFVKQIFQLQQEDLVGCAPDSLTAEAVMCHLGLIYNREFTPSDTVSVLRFTYL